MADHQAQALHSLEMRAVGGAWGGQAQGVRGACSPTHHTRITVLLLERRKAVRLCCSYTIVFLPSANEHPSSQDFFSFSTVTSSNVFTPQRHSIVHNTRRVNRTSSKTTNVNNKPSRPDEFLIALKLSALVIHAGRLGICAELAVWTDYWHPETQKAMQPHGRGACSLPTEQGHCIVVKCRRQIQ